MNCLKHIIALLCTITLWGCQHGIDPDELDLPPEPRIRGYEVSGIKPDEAEKELKEIAATPYPPYTIQGGDSFRIRVYNEEELNSAASTSTVVTPDGYLIMGLIDPVNVKDLTIIEATNKLRKELSKFVKNPAVSLLPERIQGKSATLYGSRQRPRQLSGKRQYPTVGFHRGRQGIRRRRPRRQYGGLRRHKQIVHYPRRENPARQFYRGARTRKPASQHKNFSAGHRIYRKEGGLPRDDYGRSQQAALHELELEYDRSRHNHAGREDLKKTIGERRLSCASPARPQTARLTSTRSA